MWNRCGVRECAAGMSIYIYEYRSSGVVASISPHTADADGGSRHGRAGWPVAASTTPPLMAPVPTGVVVCSAFVLALGMSVALAASERTIVWGSECFSEDCIPMDRADDGYAACPDDPYPTPGDATPCQEEWWSGGGQGGEGGNNQ